MPKRMCPIKSLFVFALTFFLLISLVIPQACYPKSPNVQIAFPTLLTDNQNILFSYIRLSKDSRNKIATYNTTTSAVHIYNNIGISISSPVYSRDNKTIAFISGNAKGSNIYVVKADGTDIRQITKNIPYNEIKGLRLPLYHNPTFSPDGKRIIFTRCGGLCFDKSSAFALPNGKIFNNTNYCDWDIYTVDVGTGNERKLTDYKFFKISKPYFLADGKRFIFSGEGKFTNNTGKGPKDSIEYEKLYKKNYIFIMDGKKNVLKPAFAAGRHAYKPSVSNDGTIQYLSKFSEMVGDLYQYKGNDINRLTKLNAHIGDAAISPDGNYSIFNIYTGMKSNPTTLWIIKRDGTGMREIVIPQDKLW